MSLAVVAAVLCHDRVVFVETSTPALVRSVPLGDEGLAVFAAPDARVLVPLRLEDATAVIGPGERVDRWPGRTFPLFFEQPDRMYGVVSEALLTLSYPERLALGRVALPGVAGAWRAACSADGRMVAVVPATPSRATLVQGFPIEGGPPRSVALAGAARDLAVAPGGLWVAVSLAGGAVEVVLTGQARGSGAISVGGEVRAIAASADGRDLLVGLETAGAGKLLVLRLTPRAGQVLKERFQTTLPAPPVALAVAAEEVLAVTASGLAVLSRGGRRLRHELPLEGGQAVAVLPGRLGLALPPWSDGTSP